MEIAACENVPNTTALYRAIDRNDNESRSRSGRPRERDERNECRLLRAARFSAKTTYRQLIEDLKLPFGITTIKTILKQHHITKWRCVKRPHL